jgi:hypothetical protein
MLMKSSQGMMSINSYLVYSLTILIEVIANPEIAIFLRDASVANIYAARNIYYQA